MVWTLSACPRPPIQKVPINAIEGTAIEISFPQSDPDVFVRILSVPLTGRLYRWSLSPVPEDTIKGPGILNVKTVGFFPYKTFGGALNAHLDGFNFRFEYADGIASEPASVDLKIVNDDTQHTGLDPIFITLVILVVFLLFLAGLFGLFVYSRETVRHEFVSFFTGGGRNERVTVYTEKVSDEVMLESTDEESPSG